MRSASCWAASSTRAAARWRPAINERALAVRLEELPGRQVVAIAGGRDKPRAIAAVLRERAGHRADHRRGDRPRAGGARRGGAAPPGALRSIERRPQGELVMHDKERDLMRAFARGRLDRRELLRERRPARPGRRRGGLPAERGADRGAGRRLRLAGQQGQDRQPAAQQASLRGRDDREPRQRSSS